MKRTLSLFEGERGEKIVIASTALLNFIFHIAFAGNLEHHRDELLYFAQGMNPAWGYNSVPPLTGWIASIIGSTLGYSVYAVRFYPALLSSAMIFLVASLARSLGGKVYARILSVTGLSVSIWFMRSFSLFQPVCTEIFLWTLILWVTVKYINTRSARFLFLIGFVAGIALLNKYLAALLLLGLASVIPFTQYRWVFIKKEFLAGIAGGTVIFLPNIIWQVTNGIPALGHVGELYETQLVNVSPGLFLMEQLMMPFTGSILVVSGIIYLLFHKGSKEFRFTGFLAVFIIAGLLILKGKSYYTLGIFPFLTAAGAVAIEKWVSKKVIRIAIPAVMIILTVPMIPMGIPVLGKEPLKKYFAKLEERYGMDLGRRFEDGSIHSLPQDYADMIGWEELTSVAAKGWDKIENKKAAFIYAENYGQAGAVTVIGKSYGLPSAVCFHESFIYWIPRDFDEEITSLVYINDELGNDVKALFAEAEIIGSITDPDAREFGTTVWLCRAPVRSFNALWKERLKELDAE